MHRTSPVCALGMLAATLLLAVGTLCSRSPVRSNSVRLSGAAVMAFTNPVQFTKVYLIDNVVGGIGAGLATNPVSGLPYIGSVSCGSPADQAGLHFGDVITKIDGVTTTSMPLTQVVEGIRGLRGSKIILTVQRGSSTMECVLHRSSWNGLRSLPESPYE